MNKLGMKVKAPQEKIRHRSRDVLIDHYISGSESAQPYFAKIFEVVARSVYLIVSSVF